MTIMLSTPMTDNDNNYETNIWEYAVSDIRQNQR